MAHGLNAASHLLLCSSQANSGFYNFKALLKNTHMHTKNNMQQTLCGLKILKCILTGPLQSLLNPT